jgi:hypothetical protein
VVEVLGHATAVVNGVLYDTYDPADNGLVQCGGPAGSRDVRLWTSSANSFAAN